MGTTSSWRPLCPAYPGLRAAGREPESPMHGKHRRFQTCRAPRSGFIRKQGWSGVIPECEFDCAGGKSTVRAWRPAGCMLYVNLDVMRVKGLV
jgi:hypothetical protein